MSIPLITTSRWDVEDGHTLEGYLRTGGYEGLRRALEMTPDQVHEEVKKASLLGRGGAGFPAGIKWGFLPSDVWPRYLVVNGDESEPGTYKDRLLIERDPHQLIEGCVITCFALGLSQCFLYVRGEMAHGQERVASALNEAYDHGYVGRNILGTEFSVDVILHWGAGAYIVGEETALIESLEGNRGMPRLKPPFFPASIGLYGKPTIVNNVETLSNIPWIIEHGGDAFAKMGAEQSTGTRIFAVSGHVQNPGVFEVEFGTTTFRDLIMGDEYAGGFHCFLSSVCISVSVSVRHFPTGNSPSLTAPISTRISRVTSISCVANMRRISRFLPSVSSSRTQLRVRLVSSNSARSARSSSPRCSTPVVSCRSTRLGTLAATSSS